MKSDCEICRGAGTIRLPVYREASYVARDVPPSLDTAVRSYPCPECGGDSVSQDRVAVVQWHHDIDRRADDPSFRDAMARRAAAALAVKLLRGGYITIERGKTDTMRQTFPIRATVGVVASHYVATMEERAAERQEAFAREVIRVASASIQHWGSYYGSRTLSKGQAIDSLAEALAATLAEQRGWNAYAFPNTPESVDAGPPSANGASTNHPGDES